MSKNRTLNSYELIVLLNQTAIINALALLTASSNWPEVSKRSESLIERSNATMEYMKENA